MAGVDHEKRVAREHIEATGRGARGQARIEQRFVEGSPEILLGHINGAGNVLCLVSGLREAHRIGRARGKTAHRQIVAHEARKRNDLVADNHGRHPAGSTAITHHLLHLRLVRSLPEHREATRLDHGSLFCGNLRERVTQDAHMVETDSRHRNAHRVRGARCIPSATEADLEDCHLNARLGKRHERGYGEQVERRDGIALLSFFHTTGVHPATRLGRCGDAVSEHVVGNHAATDLHPLRIANKVRRGVERRPAPLAAQDRLGEAHGRALPVGARHLKHIKGLIGAPKFIEHIDNGLEKGTCIPGNGPGIGSEAHRLVKRELGNIEGDAVGFSMVKGHEHGSFDLEDNRAIVRHRRERW